MRLNVVRAVNSSVTEVDVDQGLGGRISRSSPRTWWEPGGCYGLVLLLDWKLFSACSRGGQLQLRRSRPFWSKTRSDDGKISVSIFVLTVFPFFLAVLAKAIGVLTAILQVTTCDRRKSRWILTGSSFRGRPRSGTRPVAPGICLELRLP